MKAYFIGDLHLGASYSSDNREKEKKVISFLDSIKDDASELYLMGDVLDYWFEYKYVVPRGYVRFFGKLSEMADNGVKITWIIGNHDIWIFDYIPKELGIEVVDGILEREIMGTRFCLQHGDAIGGSRKFRLMRKLFRNKFCQKLYSGIHPRWTVGFAEMCSRRSREQQAKGKKVTPNLINDIREWCKGQIREGNPAKYYVFGHLHSQYDEELPKGRRLIVLPYWPTTGVYGTFDGERFILGGPTPALPAREGGKIVRSEISISN